MVSPPHPRPSKGETPLDTSGKLRPMSRRDEVLTTHREAIRAIAARHNADHIALIGSVARGDDTDDSDFDFLGNFRPGTSLFDLAALTADLEKLLGRHVDVVSIGGLRPEDEQVIKEAVLL